MHSGISSLFSFLFSFFLSSSLVLSCRSLLFSFVLFFLGLRAHPTHHECVHSEPEDETETGKSCNLFTTHREHYTPNKKNEEKKRKQKKVSSDTLQAERKKKESSIRIVGIQFSTRRWRNLSSLFFASVFVLFFPQHVLSTNQTQKEEEERREQR